MGEQINVFTLFDAEPDYVRLNQMMLKDRLVEVPGAIRVIDIPDDD